MIVGKIQRNTTTTKEKATKITHRRCYVSAVDCVRFIKFPDTRPNQKKKNRSTTHATRSRHQKKRERDFAMQRNDKKHSFGEIIWSVSLLWITFLCWSTVSLFGLLVCPISSEKISTLTNSIDLMFDECFTQSNLSAKCSTQNTCFAFISQLENKQKKKEWTLLYHSELS